MTTPTELEDRLRTMLRERAGDIASDESFPARTAADLTATGLTDTETGRGVGRRSRAWLLSAAAIAIVAAGLGTLVVARADRHQAAGPTTPTAATAPTTAPAVPSTAVAPDQLQPAAVAGYQVRATGSFPGYRYVGWHRDGDLGRASAANIGSAVSVQAVVLDAGRFPEGTTAQARLPLNTPRIDGSAVFALSLPQYRSGRAAGPDTVRSLAWQFAAHRWAVVQQLTDMVTPAELRALAESLHPARTVAITVPFRLRNVPGQLVEAYDNRPYYPQTLVFRDGSLTTTVQVHEKADRSQPREDWIAHYVSGLPGYLIPQQGGYVEYARGVMTISAARPGGEPDRSVVGRVFAGLTWSGGDGSGPGVPLGSALGR